MREDILPLVWHFLRTGNDRRGESWEITEEAILALCAHDWPGNVRELSNTIRRACILAHETVISTELLPFSLPKNLLLNQGAGVEVETVPLWVVERDHIQKVIEKVEGNKSRAAKILEIDRKTLYTKLERYGLSA
jgi:two-component system NtrC family response regulator